MGFCCEAKLQVDVVSVAACISAAEARLALRLWGWGSYELQDLAFGVALQSTLLTPSGLVRSSTTSACTFRHAGVYIMQLQGRGRLR